MFLKRKILFAVSLFFFFSLHFIQGQDIHFSQFYACPLNSNPANTGAFVGDWRASFNYKSQWRNLSPFNTFAMSYEQQKYFKRHHFSFGGVFFNDRTNISKLNQSRFLVSGAYHKLIGRNYFHVGLQSGLLMYSLDDNISFPEQYDLYNAVYDESFFSGEELNTHPASLDINFGLAWNRKITQNLETRLGVAVYHLNTPKTKLLRSDEGKLPRRKVITGRATYNLSSKMYLSPAFVGMAMQDADEIYLGSNITYVLEKNLYETSVFSGLYIKNLSPEIDAIIFVVGLNYKEWQAGISYDINVSNIDVATENRGGLEFSLIYNDISTRIKQFTLPCERF